jgi:hypothetical protein
MSAASSDGDSLASSNSQSSAVNIANSAKLTGLVQIARNSYEQSANDWFQIFDELEQEGLISKDLAQYEEEKVLVKEYLETLHELNGHRLQLDLTQDSLDDMRAMYDRYEAVHKNMSEFLTVSKMPPPPSAPMEPHHNIGEFEAVAKKQLEELQKFARESLEAGRLSDLKSWRRIVIFGRKDERKTGESNLQRKIEEERVEAEKQLTILQEELKSRLAEERKTADEKLEAEKKAAEEKLEEERNVAEEKLAGERSDAEHRLKEERELAERKLKAKLKVSREELEREMAEKSKSKLDFDALEERFQKARSEFANEKTELENRIKVISSRNV